MVRMRSYEAIKCLLPTKIRKLRWVVVSIIGIVFVTCCVLGGFALVKGPFMALVQPAEIIIIGGAAFGTIFISTPMPVIKILAGKVMGILNNRFNKQTYLELLTLMYELFNKARRDGLISLEAELANPKEGAIIGKYPSFLMDHHAVNFMVDTLKLMVNGISDQHELEKLMDAELETHHEEGGLPAAVLNKVGDSLPGLGIVAAVLGIVVTMQSIGGAVEEVGHHVGAALVGTFLGVLLAYGYVGPLATRVEHDAQEEGKYLECIKAGLLSFAGGTNPMIAVEFARKVIFTFNRPSNDEMEGACRQAKAGASQQQQGAA
jgi:chemotaxis protein MotA